jgi:hypothetical protein
LTLLLALMCASTWPSGRSDPNPEQVFGQAFETLTELGFSGAKRNSGDVVDVVVGNHLELRQGHSVIR